MDIHQKTVVELKVLLRARGLKVSGNKKELITRLSTSVPATSAPAGEINYKNKTVKELKELLREKGLPLSGNKQALIGRLTGTKKSPELRSPPLKLPKTKKSSRKTPKMLPIVVTKYSPYSYKIAGKEATIKNKAKLMQLGAIYRPDLKGGPGWLVKAKDWSKVDDWLENLPFLEYDVVWPAKEEKEVEVKEEELSTVKPIIPIKKIPKKKLIIPDYLATLPLDISRKLLITQFSHQHLVNLCSVNKYFRDVVCNIPFWKEIIRTNFPQYWFVILPKYINSWKYLFIVLSNTVGSNNPPENGSQDFRVGIRLSLNVRIKDPWGVKIVNYTDVGIVLDITRNQKGNPVSLKYLLFTDRLDRYRIYIGRGEYSLKKHNPKKWIDPVEYDKQPKKNTRTLKIQNASVYTKIIHPYLAYKDGSVAFYVGQKISYFPFRYSQVSSDGEGTDIINGEKYIFEVIGVRDGEIKLRLVEHPFYKKSELDVERIPYGPKSIDPTRSYFGRWRNKDMEDKKFGVINYIMYVRDYKMEKKSDEFEEQTRKHKEEVIAKLTWRTDIYPYTVEKFKRYRYSLLDDDLNEWVQNIPYDWNYANLERFYTEVSGGFLRYNKFRIF